LFPVRYVMIVARQNSSGKACFRVSRAAPPFRADHVGSLLRPAALRQAFRQHAAGEITDDVFAAVQDGCIRDAVALQEQTGLQVVTDGEFRRGSYWGRFVERTEGLEIRPASFKFRDDADHEVEFTGPYAKAKIGRRRPLAADEFIFLRHVTKVTAKITLPAPSTMHFFRFDDFADPAVYSDVEAFFAGRLPRSPMPVAAMSSSTRSQWRCCAIRQSVIRSKQWMEIRSG
jgi:5-methyltetrahydropteroyltriglutamate--homocysteine methyltransferase